jgi:polysaccharide biosynthesis transport protein
MPGPMLVAPQTKRTKQFSRDLKNVIGVAQRGWRLIAISMVVCLTLAVIYLARTKKEYQATTRLLVLQQGSRPLNVASADNSHLSEDAEDYIPTHALLISSPLVVGRAIESIGLENLPTLQDVARADLDPVREAIDRLKVVRPDRLAKILSISYRAGSPEEATRMLKAISQSYENFLGDTFQKKSGEVITLIAKARDELSRELGDLELKYMELRGKMPTLAGDDAGRTLIARRLEQWDRAVNEATLKSVQLKSQLELGRKLARNGTELWAVSHAMSQLGGDSNELVAMLNAGPVTAGTTDYIRQLVQKRQQLSEKYGPHYTKVQEIQDQITRALERPRGDGDRPDRGETSELLTSIDESLQAVEAMRAKIAQQFEYEQGNAKQIGMDQLSESNLRSQLDRQRSLFNTVVDQLKQAQFVGDFNSIAAHSIEPANALTRAVWPRTTPVIGAAMLTGLMLGVWVAFMADHLDQKIHLPEEIRQALESVLLGLIPQVRDKAVIRSASFGMICHTEPRSLWAEAYRGFRSNLELLRRKGGIQVVLVTGPNVAEGKSTTASNLAISLAQAGRRVLLVDGDLRKPSQHLIYNMSRDRGLSQLLTNTMSLDEVVQPTAVANLDLITAGPSIPNPAELFASSRFTELVNEFRGSYELVIIDSSPLLLVTDPAIIGAVVDGVIVVIRPAKLKHEEAERVKETLQALGTPVLGILINGVDISNDTYGYGRSRYGTYGGYGETNEETAGAGKLANPTDLELDQNDSNRDEPMSETRLTPPYLFRRRPSRASTEAASEDQP